MAAHREPKSPTGGLILLVLVLVMIVGTCLCYGVILL